MFSVPDQYRCKGEFWGIYSSDESYGNNGMFLIPYRGKLLQCLASDGKGWEHVSVSLKLKKKKSKAYKQIQRCPSWEEMCFVKSLFWGKEDAVVQFHPPESLYVNTHPFCLHLWKPNFANMPVPDPILVGIKKKEGRLSFAAQKEEMLKEIRSGGL